MGQSVSGSYARDNAKADAKPKLKAMPPPTASRIDQSINKRPSTLPELIIEIRRFTQNCADDRPGMRWYEMLWYELCYRDNAWFCSLSMSSWRTYFLDFIVLMYDGRLCDHPRAPADILLSILRLFGHRGFPWHLLCQNQFLARPIPYPIMELILRHAQQLGVAFEFEETTWPLEVLATPEIGETNCWNQPIMFRLLLQQCPTHVLTKFDHALLSRVCNNPTRAPFKILLQHCIDTQGEAMNLLYRSTVQDLDLTLGDQDHSTTMVANRLLHCQCDCESSAPTPIQGHSHWSQLTEYIAAVRTICQNRCKIRGQLSGMVVDSIDNPLFTKPVADIVASYVSWIQSYDSLNPKIFLHDSVLVSITKKG